ncbi:heterokaryon incompatibility protein-domain-containing protein [Nemania sp. NC0429]|nr:heterokaryon incompatibility protein-domain-containing protein [Nemania sp. NC0429]
MAAVSLGNPKASSLCAQCNDLQRLGRNGRPRRLETTVASVEASAKSGCRLCRLLVSGIDVCLPTWGPQKRAKSSLYELEAEFPFEGLSLCLDWIGDKGDRHQASVDFFTVQPNDCPWTCIGAASDICGDTSSDAAVEKVARWIQQCTQNHAFCNRETLTSLPNRVVDVGDPAHPHPPQVKLRETQKNERARYLCLSHCWGTEQIIQTKRSTLEQHKRCIPWDELSRTFQDAIVFARKLGVRYIWIDSLCIIQDSDDDWRAESAQMAAIYENAYVTLAATKSRNGAGGCFSSAAPECRARELRCDDEDGVSHPVYVRRNLHDAYDNPLLGRGWVFQERLLSPRVVHFSAQELYWECMEAVACECSWIRGGKEDGEKEESQQRLSSISEYLLRTMLGKISHGVNLASRSAQVLKDRWHEIVEEYTHLALTFEKDKFPALSGVARQMRRVRDAEYVAGLWGDNMIEDLLWRTFALSAERPAKWRAPTWSWASINGRIQYLSNNPKEASRTFAEVLSIECTPLTPNDSMMELASATLVISSYVVPAVLSRNPNTNNAPSLMHRYQLEAAADGEEHYGFQSDYTLPDPDVEDISGEWVYCLWMRCVGSSSSYWRCDCLVLRMVDAAEQVYERLGIAWISKYPGYLSQPLGDGQVPFDPQTERVVVKLR